MISFIVPAHNEQKRLGTTLPAINQSAAVIGQPFEVIVVDDASTDATAEVARQHNATVITVNHRQIAATRNSGGRAAKGERFFFVDADTTINPRSLAEALRYMDKGAVGGGGPVLFDGIVPLYIRIFSYFGVIGVKLAGFTGGAFMFCTREAFHATGGFDERLYWAEEGAFTVALKRQGRFVVLWRPVLTSARRCRSLSALKLSGLIARAVFSPFKIFTRRASVEKIWYDSNRADDDKPPTPATRVSNGILLVITIALLSGPIWNFIPWSLTPRASPLGRMRLVIGIFLCHVGLIFWPCAIFLFWSLLSRKHWLEWLKLAALAVFCLWQAWDCTEGVIWFWPWLFHRLTQL